MDTLHNPLELLEKNADLIRSFGVVKIGLFGSVLQRDKFNEKSDVDVYAEFDPNLKTLDNFFNLHEKLEELYKKNVDLVTKESLSPYLGPDILATVKYAKFVS